MQTSQRAAIENVAHSGERTKHTASLYRTKWLMAHNAIHEAAHNGDAKKAWANYLDQLKTAEEVASLPG